MTQEELKIRQLSNQYLITPGCQSDVFRNLCGFQAQFFSNAVHACAIRCTSGAEPMPETQLVKNWTLRGTLHLFATEDLPLFLHCGENGETYRRNEWSAPSFWNQRKEWALTPARQAYLSEVVLEALARGPQTRAALKNICLEQGMTAEEAQSMFHPWGGGIRQLCERGFINCVAQEEKAYCLSPVFSPLPKAAAELEIARRYFTHFAPATIHDAMYFLHASAKQVRQWLSALPVQTVECGNRVYYFIETDQPCPCKIPDCLFLAGFDPLLLGYEKRESPYLNLENLRSVFTLSGIVKPAVLLDGQVAGTWKKNRQVVTLSLFNPVAHPVLSGIEAAAEAQWGAKVSVQFVRA